MPSSSDSQNPHVIDEDLAIETRAELLRTVSLDVDHRRGDSDRLEIGRSSGRDTVNGRETLRVGGSLTEETRSRTINAQRLETAIAGKMHAVGLGDTTLVGGAVAETYHGPLALVAGMSDDLVAGAGMRVSTPLDIWLGGLMGIDEHVGTAVADAALVEASATYFEREYGPGNQAAVAAVFFGQLYTTMATGIRPLYRVLKGIRDLSPGGGGGGSAGGGAAGGGAAAGGTVGGGAMLAGGAAASTARMAGSSNIDNIADAARISESLSDVGGALDELADIGDVSALVARFDLDNLAQDDLARASDTVTVLEDLRAGADDSDAFRAATGSDNYNQGARLDQADQADQADPNWMNNFQPTPPPEPQSRPPTLAEFRIQEITDANQNVAPILQRWLSDRRFKRINFSDADSVRAGLAKVRKKLQTFVFQQRGLLDGSLGGSRAALAQAEDLLASFNDTVKHWESAVFDAQNALPPGAQNILNYYQNPPPPGAIPSSPPPRAATPPPVEVPPPAWNFDDAFETMQTKCIDYRRDVSWDAHIQLRRTQESLSNVMQSNEALMRELMDPDEFARLDFNNIDATARNRQALANLQDTLTDPADIARVTDALENFDAYAEYTIAADLNAAANFDALPRTNWPFEVDKPSLLGDLNREMKDVQDALERIEDGAERARRTMEAGPEVTSYNNAIKEMEAGNNPLFQLDSEIRMAEYRVEIASPANLAQEQSFLAGLQRVRDRINSMIYKHSLESADDILRRYQNAFGGSLAGPPGTASNPFQVVMPGRLVDNEQVASSIAYFKNQADADLFGGEQGAYRILASAEDELRQVAVNFRPMLESSLAPEDFARINFNDFSSVRQGLEILANGSNADEALLARQTLANFDRHIRDTIEAAMTAADNARGRPGSWLMSDRQLLSQALGTEANRYEKLAAAAEAAADADPALVAQQRQTAAHYRSLVLATQSGGDPLQIIDGQIQQLVEPVDFRTLSYEGQQAVVDMVRNEAVSHDAALRMVLSQEHARFVEMSNLLQDMRANLFDIVSDYRPMQAAAADLVDVLQAPSRAKMDEWANMWRPLQATPEIDEFRSSVAKNVRFVDGQGAAGGVNDLLRADDLTNANGVLPRNASAVASPMDAMDGYAVLEDVGLLTQNEFQQWQQLSESTLRSGTWPTPQLPWAWPAPRLPLPNRVDGTELATALRGAENSITNPNNLPLSHQARSGLLVMTEAQEAVAMRTAAFRIAMDAVADGMDPVSALDEFITLAKTKHGSKIQLQAYQDVQRAILDIMTTQTAKVRAQSLNAGTASDGRHGFSNSGGAAPGAGNNRATTAGDAVDAKYVPPPPPPRATSNSLDAVDAIDSYGRLIGDTPPSGTSQADAAEQARRLEDADAGWDDWFKKMAQRRREERRRRLKSFFRWRNPFSISRSYTRKAANLEDAMDADVVLRLEAGEAAWASRKGGPVAGQSEELRHVIDSIDEAYSSNVGTLAPARPPRPGQQPGGIGSRPPPPLPDATDPAYKTVGNRPAWITEQRLVAPADPNYKIWNPPMRRVSTEVLRAEDAVAVTEDGVLVFHLDEVDIYSINAGRTNITVLAANGDVVPLSGFRLETMQNPGYNALNKQVTGLLNIAFDHSEALQESRWLEHADFLSEIHTTSRWMDFPMPPPREVSPPRVQLMVDETTGIGTYVPVK